METKKPTHVTWMCTWCGLRAHTSIISRPSPGNCPRRPKTRDGRSAPHRWVKENKW